MNIPVVRVIEEKAKVFELIKNILKSGGGEKSIFLYGEADFSGDIKKYAEENGVLIFRYASPAGFGSEADPDYYGIADLVILGDCKKNIDLSRLGNIKSILLNIDGLRGTGGLENINKDAQVVTCGLKEKDTAIFSSINLDEGNVILDLQRSVSNINGETIEPFEKQMEIPDYSKKDGGKSPEFSAGELILALTALTLCGRV